ncbi:tachykinin-3b isoform X1 [Ictalurus punctatus]|uniref:Tachykinin-3b isoform X1 n=1 Tax=Ictalurus punctatus TaxID=7998 RepID=A0A979F3S5_ICTPU|nr:tachykinin-3b isoform X1 [Ictalurus punctatus]
MRTMRTMRTMRSCVLHLLFLLLLSCKTSFSSFTVQDSSGREMRQYNEVEDDSFIGLMGKRSSDLTAELPRRRDVSDVFVGLFGRRDVDSGESDIAKGLAAWRRERRGGVFSNNRRLRYRRPA